MQATHPKRDGPIASRTTISVLSVIGLSVLMFLNGGSSSFAQQYGMSSPISIVEDNTNQPLGEFIYCQTMGYISVLAGRECGNKETSLALEVSGNTAVTFTHTEERAIGVAGSRMNLVGNIKPTAYVPRIFSTHAFPAPTISNIVKTVSFTLPDIATYELLPVKKYAAMSIGTLHAKAETDTSAKVSGVPFLDRLSLTLFCTFASASSSLDKGRCNYNTVAQNSINPKVEVPVTKNEEAISTSVLTTGSTTAPQNIITYINRYITVEGAPGRDGIDGNDGRDGKDGTNSSTVNSTSIPAGFGSYVLPSYSSPGTAIGVSTIGYLKDTVIEHPSVSDGVFAGTNLFTGNTTFTGTTAFNLLNATSSNFISASTTNAYISNLFVTSATSTDSYISRLIAASSTLTDAMLTNSTTTNAYISNLVAASSTLTDIVATNATSTNLFATNASFTNATSSSLFSTNGTFTSATTTNLFTTNLAVGNASTTGNQSISGTLNVNGTTTLGSNTILQGSVVLGTSTSNFITVNGLFDSGLVPAANITYDLGSPSFYWRNGYVNTLNVNTLSAGSTTISGTANSSFAINTGNGTSDTQDSSLVFFRGLVTPNAVLRWNSTTKRLESNMSLSIQNETPVTGTTTLSVQAGAGQGSTNIFELLNNVGSKLSIFNANGWLGIGSTTPGSALTVIGNAYVGGNITATGTLTTAGTTTLATAGGNVGIGTTTPGSKLQVAGDIRLGVASTTAGQLIFQNSSNGFTTTLRSSSTQTSNLTLTLPNATGTLNQALLTDGAGGTYWGPAGVTGGQAGFIPRWLTSSLQGTSTLLDNGIVAGVNATSSSYSFNIQGAAGVNPLNVASSSGTSLFTVLHNGNVGIGTINPTQKLVIQQDQDALSYLDYYNTTAGPNAGVYFRQVTQNAAGTGTIASGLLKYATGELRLINGESSVTGFTTLYTAGQERLRVNASGNVGIGTSTPASLLTIYGAGNYGQMDIVSSAANGETGLLFKSADDSDPLGWLIGKNVGLTDDSFSIFRGGNFFTINTNGNIGIGTSTPQGKLSIAGADENSSRLRISNEAFSGVLRGIELYQNNGGDAVLNNRRNDSIGDLLFQTNDGNTKLTIKNSGNVGIGTSTPLDKLTVAGNISIPFGGSLKLNGTNGVVANTNIIGTGWNGSQDFTSFYTAGNGNPNPIMTLLHTGNVGIGTSTPESLLHVQGTSTGRVLLGTLGDFPTFGGIGFQSTLTSANYSIAANINGSTLINTVNGTNVDFRVSNVTKMLLSNLGLLGIGSTTPSSMLSITGNPGVTPLVTVASSTGTSLFTILANGNIGIGTSTPTAKLHISQTDTPLGVLFNGITKGIRFGFNSGNSSIEGVDSTGVGSYQPLFVNGSALQLATGGAERVRIDSNGNVGIGTTTPQTLLHLSSATPSSGGLLIESTSGSAGGIADIELRGRRDDTNGSTPFGGSLYLSRLNAVGNITAGVNDTFSQLGNILFGGNAGGTTASSIVYPASIGGAVEGTFTSSTTANTGIVFRTGATGLGKDTVNALFGTERLRITSIGAVGIGTTTPSGTLTITGTNAQTNGYWSGFNFGKQLIINTTGGSNNPGLGIFDYTGANPWGVHNSTGDLYFSQMPAITDSTTPPSVRLSIKAGGNVGIGTTTPGSSLSIQATGGVNPFIVASSTGTSLFSILQSGNVLIGATTSIEKLTLDSTAQNALKFEETGISRGWVGISAGTGGILPGSLNNDLAIRSENNLLLGSGGYNTNLYLSTNGNVGIGTNSPSSKLTVASTLTDTSGFVFGSYTSLTASPSGPSTASFYGNLTTTTSAGANISASNNIYGTFADAIHNTSATIGNVSGLYNRIQNNSTGTIGNGRALEVTVLNNATGTISNASGVYINTPGNGSGTLTNTYGLFIGSQTVGIQTNTPYGIYQAGTADRNYFGGNVGIGTTTPGSKLSVAGDTRVTGNIDNTLGLASSTIVSSLALASTPLGVAVVGKYAYTVRGSGSTIFNVIDVSDPSSPTIVGSSTFSGGSPSVGIYVVGNYAYIRTTSAIRVVDISKPYAPTSVSTYTALSDFSFFYVAGRYLYTTHLTPTNKMQIIDTADPTNLVAVGTITVGSDATSVTVSGKYAYVSNNGSNTLQIIDISTPSAPVSMSTLSTVSTPKRVVVSGKYAYITSATTATMQVADVSSSTAPTVVGTVTTSGNNGGLVLAGRYVIGAQGTAVNVIDVASSTAPRLVSNVTLPSTLVWLAVEGRYAYGINGNAMHIVDIGGLETSAATIASLEAGTAQIRNDLTVQGNIFTNALNAATAYIENLSARVFAVATLTLGSVSSTVSNAILSINTNTSGTELVTKNSASGFTVSGYATTTGVDINPGTQGGGITLLLASTASIGNGTMSAGPSLNTGTLDDGGHAIQRPDGKYLIINGNATTATNVYDPVTNTFTAGPTLSSGTVQHGGHSIQRPDGKFLVVNANNTAATNIYDPVANTFATGPSLASSVANYGSHSIQRPDGKFLLINANITANTNIYDPVANSFAAGPSLATSTAYAGAHSIQRPDGKFLVINGNNTNATNIYDPIANTFVAGPTLASGTVFTGGHAIQRPDGKFLVINGGATTVTNIYDPIANTFTTGPSLGTPANHGAHSIQRPDGKFLVIDAGSSSSTDIYDPVTNTFTSGPFLSTGSSYNGSFSIQRPDGKFLIVNGNVGAVTNIYDPSYVMTGSWESEDINMTDLNQSSVLNFNTNGEGKIEVAIKTATSTGALAASYTMYATTTSGSKILPVSGALYAKVKVTLTRPVPTNRQPTVNAKQTNTWLGESETKYQRTFANPILYSFNISNQKGYHVTNTDFGTNAASTTLTSNATSGPIISNLSTDGGLTLPYTLDVPDFTATGDDKGAMIQASSTPTTISTGSFSIQRPDGKFLLAVGNASAATYIYDPTTSTYANGPSMTAGIGSGAHVFQRPDGKFFVVIGNSSATTNIYDPIANTFTAGPNLIGNASGGSNTLQRPDGKFLIYRGGTTSTDIYDPIANTVSAGPTIGTSIGMGSLSIQRPDGKFFVTPGGAGGPTYTYDPIANTFVSNGYTVATDYGATAIQRPDGKWYILYGGSTATAYLYDPVSNTGASAPGGAQYTGYYGTNVTQRPDGKFAIFQLNGTAIWDPVASSPSAGPNLNANYTGGHGFLRPDGKFITYNGNGSALAYQYDSGWLTRGSYDSEFVNDATLDSNSVLTWKGNADAYKAGIVSFKVRTATSSDTLQTAPWRTLSVSGARINPGTNETWMQVHIDFNRPISTVTQPGAGKNVMWTESNIIYNRLPLNPSAGYSNQAQTYVKPTIYSYAIQKQEGQDLATFQVNGNNAFRFSATGDAYTSAGGSWNAGGADVAEYFPTEDGLLEPGDIVSVSKDARGLVSMTTESYDDTALGVVTTAPGLRLGSDDVGANQNKQPIALGGRVPVKVSLENGVIHKGDYLTSSSRPGFAMKALDAGRVIGIALEDYTLEQDSENNGAGKVLVFVNPHFYIGATFATKVSSVFSRFAVMIQKGISELGVTILDNGNVGIGVNNPLSRLQIAGDVRLGVASTTTGHLLFQNEANVYTTTLQSATSTAISDLTFTLPSTLGNPREVLMTDGTGGMYWGAVAKVSNTASTTTGYALRWLPDGEVASGVLMDDGLVAGVNATSTSAFTVAQATSTQNAFSILSSLKDAFFSVDATGMVSVGTSTSGSRFDIFDKTQDASKDLFRVVSNVGSDNDVKFKVSASGDLFAASSLTIGLGAGVAESYTATEAVDGGTVVAFATTTSPWPQMTATGTESYDVAGIRKAVTDAEAIGVVSTNAGLSLATKTSGGVPVTFVGRVPVKVTTESGVIKAGDYLTVSKTVPGSAMKLVGEGRALGRAVSDYVEGRDKVMVIIDNRDLMLDMEGKFATTTKMLTVGNVDLNANGVSIINIKSLVSASGAWSIDENGKLVTKELCLEDVCINKNELRNLLQASGQGSGSSNQEGSSSGTTTDQGVGTSTPPGEVAGVSTSTEPIVTPPDEPVVSPPVTETPPTDPSP